MPTTSLGLTYPSSTDHVRIWEHLQTLAQNADTAIAARAVAPSWARKTANETVTNSTTLQNDDDLFVSVLANAVYDVRAMILYSAPTANDMKLAWTWPTSATMPWGIVGLDGAASGVTGNINPPAFDSPTSGSSSFIVGGAGAGNTIMLLVAGTLTTAATAGTLRLQWAQAVAASSTSAVVKAGSTLRVERIA